MFAGQAKDRKHVRRVHVVLDLVGGGSGLVSGIVRCINLQRVYAVLVECFRVIYVQGVPFLVAGKTHFACRRGIVLRGARPPQRVVQGIRRVALAAFRDVQALQDVVVAVVPAVSLTGFQNCINRFLFFIIRARIRRILRRSRHRRHVQIVLDVNLDFLGAKGLRDVNVIGFLILGSVVIQGSGCFRTHHRNLHLKPNRRLARDSIFAILPNVSTKCEIMSLGIRR